MDSASAIIAVLVTIMLVTIFCICLVVILQHSSKDGCTGPSADDGLCCSEFSYNDYKEVKDKCTKETIPDTVDLTKVEEKQALSDFLLGLFQRVLDDDETPFDEGLVQKFHYRNKKIATIYVHKREDEKKDIYFVLFSLLGYNYLADGRYGEDDLTLVDGGTDIAAKVPTYATTLNAYIKDVLKYHKGKEEVNNVFGIIEGDSSLLGIEAINSVEASTRFGLIVGETALYDAVPTVPEFISSISSSRDPWESILSRKMNQELHKTPNVYEEPIFTGDCGGSYHSTPYYAKWKATVPTPP